MNLFIFVMIIFTTVYIVLEGFYKIENSHFYIEEIIERIYVQKIKWVKPSKKVELYLENLTDLIDIKIYKDELLNCSLNVNQAKRRAYDKIIKRNEDKKAQEIIDSLDIKMSVLKELKGDK